MSALKDQWGRSIEYLRISVTDRCNFRCVYCMPKEGLQWLPKAEILSYEEITEVVRQLAPLGLRRLRITGGEPTIRPDLESLIRQLKAIPHIEDIALSTNGAKLPQMARSLREAGLDRVNMSADSLRPPPLLGATLVSILSPRRKLPMPPAWRRSRSTSWCCAERMTTKSRTLRDSHSITHGTFGSSS
jgi:molybdenum cofactor biosynthesis enzyme MoaA